MTNFKLLTVFALAAFTACTDDETDQRAEFLGSWAYESGQFELDCGGQLMQFAVDSSLVETFELGTATDLAKSDSGGCTGITFDVAGATASLAPSPQSCAIPNMGTSTASAYAITLGDDGKLTTASSGTFAPPQGPPCTFAGAGTLVRP